MSDRSFITNATDEALRKWNLEGLVSAETIANFVVDGTAYWEISLSNGFHLVLVRLASPVVRREEIFLGNVLLNDFLSKTLMRAVDQGNLGQIALLANDLDSYYYLYYGKSSLESIRDSFRQEISSSLPELYFGNENPDRGIYGDISRMLTFYKSNIEPYPAFSVPKVLLPQLLQKANEALRHLASDKETNINVIFAVLSFFYARNGAEMQSVHAFLKRAMDEGLLPADKIRAVFALGQGEDFEKETFMERKKGAVIDRHTLQGVIEDFLSRVEVEMAQGEAEALAPNLAEKMPGLSLDQNVDVLLNGVQIGFIPMGGIENDKSCTLPCRFCGSDAAIIQEKNITAGFGAGRFCNESPKREPFEEALCGRCGISSYLVTKLLGMHNAKPQPKSKDYPVAKQYNIVFHCGRHNQADVLQLRDTIDDIFDLVGEFRRKAIEEKHPFSLEYMKEEILRRAAERQAEDKGLSTPEEALAALIATDDVVPGLDILAQTPREERAQVLPLGSGDYRLLVFILPRLQPGREEALDFVNHRLSRSRLAAFTLLALLRKLCGCDGPYYFQSVPTLRPGGFNSDTFYVQGKAEDAGEVIRHYSAIVNFARKVSKYRDGHSLVADWILLAERLEDDPLGTFSDILRDSPIRAGDDLREAKYRRLSKEFVKGTGMIDGTEYLKMFEKLYQF